MINGQRRGKRLALIHFSMNSCGSRDSRKGGEGDAGRRKSGGRNSGGSLGMNCGKGRGELRGFDRISTRCCRNSAGRRGGKEWIEGVG